MSDMAASVARVFMALMFSDDHRKKKSIKAAPEAMASLVMSEQRMVRKSRGKAAARSASLGGARRGVMADPPGTARPGDLARGPMWNVRRSLDHISPKNQRNCAQPADSWRPGRPVPVNRLKR